MSAPETTRLWVWRPDVRSADRADLIDGFAVEALDGSIGKVDESTYETGSSYIVVDTGPWIFGKKVMLPAGVIDRIDYNDKRIYVGRTKDQIKDAPPFDEATYREDIYTTTLGDYYR
jgi:hypothetical protein